MIPKEQSRMQWQQGNNMKATTERKISQPHFIQLMDKEQIIAHDHLKPIPLVNAVDDLIATRDSTRESPEESRDDNDGKVMQARKSDHRDDTASSRHFRGIPWLSKKEESKATNSFSEVPDSQPSFENEDNSTHARQLLQRFQEAATHWTVFRDEELIEALLSSEFQEQRDHDDTSALLSGVVNIEGSTTVGIIAEVSTHISKFDVLGAMTCCLETLSTLGQSKNDSSSGEKDDTKSTPEEQQLFWSRYKSVLSFEEPPSDEKEVEPLSDVVFVGNPNHVEGARTHEVLGSQNNLEARQLLESIAAGSDSTIEESPFGDESTATTTAPPLEDAKIPRCTDQDNTGKTHGQETQKRKKNRSRVLRRVVFQCYMTWCAVRHHVRSPFSSRQRRNGTQGRRRRGHRPEWVQVPNVDSLDRMMESLETSPCRVGAGKDNGDQVTKKGSAWTGFKWGRSTRAKAGATPSTVSALTLHEDGSSLGHYMGPARIEI